MTINDSFSWEKNTKYKIQNTKFGTLFLVIFIFFFQIPFSFAADFEAVLLSPNDGIPGTSNTAISLTMKTGNYALQQGDQIIVDFPDEFSGFMNLLSNDLTFQTADTSIDNGGSVVIDDLNTDIFYTLGAGETSDAEELVSVVVGVSNFLIFPSNAGQYSVNVYVLNVADEYQEGGYFLMNMGNTTTVNIQVEEKMILTINTPTLNLRVNPAINGGIDQSQYTELSIKTNAQVYTIHGRLENAQENDNGPHYFDGTDHFYIENGFDVNDGPFGDGRNVFGFNIHGPGEADMNFSTIDTPIFENIIGQTNETLHEVYYDVNVDFRIAAGNYEGIIRFTVVPTF